MQVMVVGAGVVGLAIAREAALKGHDVIVAEAAPAIGTGTSSRNSEVIHAGLYYPSGSKRALHCPRSRRMLYAIANRTALRIASSASSSSSQKNPTSPNSRRSTPRRSRTASKT
jgi:L-2-hydroxyglutarate oxidase LhgO